jgi:hypothetical protein
MAAEVTQRHPLDMQVCVPENFTDEEVVKFANENNIAGTSSGWHITKAGDECFKGDPERVKCRDRVGHVHIMLHV